MYCLAFIYVMLYDHRTALKLSSRTKLPGGSQLSSLSNLADSYKMNFDSELPMVAEKVKYC